MMYMCVCVYIYIERERCYDVKHDSISVLFLSPGLVGFSNSSSNMNGSGSDANITALFVYGLLFK